MKGQVKGERALFATNQSPLFGLARVRLPRWVNSIEILLLLSFARFVSFDDESIAGRVYIDSGTRIELHSGRNKAPKRHSERQDRTTNY